jgi:hypothetical protein
MFTSLINDLKSRYPAAFEFALLLVCILLAIAIFATDLQIPLGVAGGVPYILLILLALWSSKLYFATYLGVLGTALTILGFYYSPEGSELWYVIFNRILALFAIWVTVIFTTLWKICEKKIFYLQNELDKERIYRSTIYGAQHIINNLLNQLILIQHRAHSGEVFDKKTLYYFDNILYESQVLMEVLSNVESMDEKVIKQSVHTCRQELLTKEGSSPNAVG